MPIFPTGPGKTAIQSYFSPRFWVILSAWILVNISVLLIFGIVTGGEAEKYITQAGNLLHTGHYTTRNFRLYSTTIWLLAFCLRFHLSFAWAVGLQMLINLLAILYFDSTVATILKSQRSALACTLLLVVALPYQQFNSFLQTESLFQSGSLLLICYLLRQTSFSWTSAGVITVAALLLSATRPNGLLYLLLIALYPLLAKPKPSAGLTFLFCLCATTLFVTLLNFAMGSGGEFDFTLPFRREHIICGCPTLEKDANIDTSGTGIFSLIYYTTHNYRQFARLAIARSASFWKVFRPYYSPLHNMGLIAFFYPIFLAALASLSKWRHQTRTFIPIITPILLTWLTVILTCDDWSNRIFLSIFPFVLLLASPVFKRWHSHRK
ncbi:MAG: hypothetical protein JST42_23730 [Bacteroidetes bacterium]|nr:hypothetical protein [Bacteroidota bacterium]